MEHFLFFLCGAACVSLLLWVKARYASFVSQSPHHYVAGRAGEFDLRTHLNGHLLCEGVIYGPFGRVTSRFAAEFDAQWTGNQGTIKEVFHYEDGSVQERGWDLTLGPDGRIQALAEDVVGLGTGQQSGDSVQLKYKLQLAPSAGGHTLDVVDWMYLAPNGIIINRSQFRKFGIQVGELVATMRPAPAALKQAA